MLGITVPLKDIEVFMMIFIRVVSMLFSMPLFDAANIPSLLKVALAISVSILIFPTIEIDHQIFTLSPLRLLLSVMAEVSMGFVIGFTIKLVFSAVQLAGQLAGFQMGFAIANVVDPVTSNQVPLISQLNNLFAMLIFLSVNAHHWLLKALVSSFDIVPPFMATWHSGLFDPVMKLTGDLFIVAIRVGAPIISIMLLISIAMGLLARAVPQIHIFIVAMPLQVMVGFLFVALTFHFLASYLGGLFQLLERDTFLLLKLMSFK